ncbi:MAG: sulfotransferase family protein [Chitinophagales bacterium]|nr:MAG: sulfotransferase family protein [Chitinophagales bacterium]
MSKGDFDFNISVISGSSTCNAIRIIKDSRVEPPYYLKTFNSLAFSLAGEPFRWWEHIRYDRQVKRFRIEEPPVFILGHWRSGTTFLHNLLCEDPTAGYITTYQTVFPELLLGGQWLFKRFMQKKLPEKRAFDNMAIAPDSPQEDEVAITNTHPYGFYNFMIYPKKTKEYYQKYVEFSGVSEQLRNYWKKKYLRIVKKALIYTKGKRFISKNPPHTGRIKVLLEMFPEARFIHIYRNPIHVFISTKKMFKASLPPLQLHNITDAQLEENILWVYERMMRAYLRDRNLIPKNQLVEVSYEEFAENPVDTIRHIYSTLCLPSFERALPSIEKHVKEQRNYRTNRHHISPQIVEKIYARWKFAMDEWDYTLPANIEMTN